MEIKRFNKLNEQVESKRYHTFAIFVDEFNEESTLPDFELFEDEKDAFNYLANYIYRIYQENDINLNILDECADAVELIEQYENEVHVNHNIKHQVIFYTPTTISGDIVLMDWIKTRRDAKKYNF